MNMPLEDFWDKPRTITARQLATALRQVDEFEVGGNDPSDYYRLWAGAIIAAIPETAEPNIEGGLAWCVCGLAVLPENWPNHLLRQDKKQHAPGPSR
jgi:hypothetical protein